MFADNPCSSSVMRLALRELESDSSAGDGSISSAASQEKSIVVDAASVLVSPWLEALQLRPRPKEFTMFLSCSTVVWRLAKRMDGRWRWTEQRPALYIAFWNGMNKGLYGGGGGGAERGRGERERMRGQRRGGGGGGAKGRKGKGRKEKGRGNEIFP